MIWISSIISSENFFLTIFLYKLVHVYETEINHHRWVGLTEIPSTTQNLSYLTTPSLLVKGKGQNAENHFIESQKKNIKSPK